MPAPPQPSGGRAGTWPWWAWILCLAAGVILAICATIGGIRLVGVHRLNAVPEAAASAGFGASLDAIHDRDPNNRPERLGNADVIVLLGNTRPVPAMFDGDWQRRFGPDNFESADIIPQPWRLIRDSRPARMAWRARYRAGPVLLGGTWDEPPIDPGSASGAGSMSRYPMPSQADADPFPPWLDLAGCIALAAIGERDPRPHLADLDALVGAVLDGRRDDLYSSGAHEQALALQVERLAGITRLALASTGRLHPEDLTAWLQTRPDLAAEYRIAMRARLHHALIEAGFPHPPSWQPAATLSDSLPNRTPEWIYNWIDIPAGWIARARAPGRAAEAARIRMAGAIRIVDSHQRLAEPPPPPVGGFFGCDFGRSDERYAVEQAQCLTSNLLTHAWKAKAMRCAVRLACSCPPTGSTPRDHAAAQAILGDLALASGLVPGIRYAPDGDRGFVLSAEPACLPDDLGGESVGEMRVDLDAWVERGEPWWRNRR